MTGPAKLNFMISRPRFHMRGMEVDIRLLGNAGLDRADAAARLARMQSELLALIGERDALACSA